MKKVCLFLSSLFLLSSCSYTQMAGVATGGSLGAIFGSSIGGLMGGPRGSDVGSLVGLMAGVLWAQPQRQSDQRKPTTKERPAILLTELRSTTPKIFSTDTAIALLRIEKTPQSPVGLIWK